MEIEQLNIILANLFVCYGKTLNLHWNATGADFPHHHKFFQDQYEELFVHVDNTAERIRALKHFPINISDAKQHATVDIYEFESNESLVETLINDFIIMISHISLTIDSAQGDHGTVNFLSDLLMKLEKRLWMLESSFRHAY